MSTGVNMGRQGTLGLLAPAHAVVREREPRPARREHPVGRLLRRPRRRAGASSPQSFADTEFGRLRRGALPGNLLADAILDVENPVRALIVVAGNPLLSIGGEARLRAALEKLDLLVCIDLYKNATGEYAHWLLPSTDMFERADINITGLGLQWQPWIQWTDAVVPAPAASAARSGGSSRGSRRRSGLRSALDARPEPGPLGPHRPHAARRAATRSRSCARAATPLVFRAAHPGPLLRASSCRPPTARSTAARRAFAEALARAERSSWRWKGEGLARLEAHDAPRRVHAQQLVRERARR